MLDYLLFKKNRGKLKNSINPGAICVFESNDQMPTNADGLMPFRQNNDLFYLTGVDQEETSLIIYPDAKNEDYREILFIKKTNETIRVWEGHKLTKKEAQKKSGIKTVLWHDEFLSILNKLIPGCSSIYLSSNEHPRANIIVESRNARLKNKLKCLFPKNTFKQAAPIMHQIRSIKEIEEIQTIQKACDITKSGFNRILKFIKPGIFEYNIQAELIHDFINHSSKGFAYEPILASGKNACILHYTDNNQVLKKGDVILMDFGAEYNNYASDLTRCVPVSGKFTTRQKKVYKSVLRVMKGAKKMLQPGVFLNDYEKNVGKLMEKELVDLGLISIEEIKRQSAPNYDVSTKVI